VIHSYQHIISIENLLIAWEEFLCGKRNRKDVEEFSLNLMGNILQLHQELKSKTYRHGPYQSFAIHDPKPRRIHKALVRDRLLHHAVHRVLYPFFDRLFIHDSYSCRDDKGTHCAMNRFREFARIVSQNHTQTAWVLKCDIQKFFANIDHTILMHILSNEINDRETLWLLHQIVSSFHIPGKRNVGLPLGNLTSQLLVNVYMNAFDQFVKRSLKVRHYIRYADDFVFLHHDRSYLEQLLPSISSFLKAGLGLSIHPQKIILKTFASGIDFLGWVHFPQYRVLRTTTKRRMFRRLNQNVSDEAISSYCGLLQHGDTHEIAERIVRLV
jgi:RNA-directed DNA polymerase